MTNSLQQAYDDLASREGIPPARTDGIGILMVHDVEDGGGLNSWALAHRLDALVWTALPPRYQNIENRIPTAPEAADYLVSLDEATQAHARDYLNKVPGQIYTAYRKFFAERLGW